MTLDLHRAVTAEGLQYSYRGSGTKDVLSDVSFDVMRGEFFVVLGPNGSGKSTLMRLLAGIDKPGSGTVCLEGMPLHHYSRQDRAKHVAFVPQILPAEFSMTVRDLVMSGRAPRQGILGLEQNEDIASVEEAMAFTGISEFSNRDFQSLSGGERQRVFIASAIAQEPSLMLLDEPTSALDPAHQIRVMDLMERLKQEKGMTIVMVLHDINLAAMYADTVLVLKKGRIFSKGTPCKALTRETLEAVYECPFLADHHPLLNVPRFSPIPRKCR
jgi:iron complex transport system ATP-binding protein